MRWRRRGMDHKILHVKTEGTSDMGHGTREADAYLEPYRQAASRHGDRFGSLLWASPRTQAARFDAICRLAEMRGRKVLDAGCGRADLMDFMISRGIGAAEYVGIEAVDELVAAAMKKSLSKAEIVHGDFVSHPERLKIGADVVVFSGSLNTLERERFY